MNDTMRHRMTRAENNAELLRRLRLRSGKSQLRVESEAELGSGYLQRLELGKVRQPTAETLGRILEVLAVGYGERYQVLHAFGYAADAPLPTANECRQAEGAARPTLDALDGTPAYVLDCAHRLVAWNQGFRALLSSARLPAVPRHFAGQCMVDLVFEPAHGLLRLIGNREEFLPYFVRVLQRKYQPYSHEPWSREQLSDLRARLPLFARYWAAAEAASAIQVSRALTPCRLDLPGHSPLTFRITAEPLAGDPRFRMIAYLPLDITTTDFCASQKLVTAGVMGEW